MGQLISLSGIDGAGKSTQVKLLSSYLKKRSKKVLVTESMFTYFLLKPLIKILRKSTGSPSGGPVKINTNLGPKLWFVLAFIDIWLGYLIDIRPKLNRYKYIIADRYYIDIWANLLYYGYIPNWAYRSLIRLLPKADLYLILLVKPGVVRKREEDFPISYYKRQSVIYKNLSKSLKLNVVDANQKPQKVFAQIKKILDTSLV